MGVVRDTFQRCQKVKQILRNLLVKFDERDCYMNRAVQNEIRFRLGIAGTALHTANGPTGSDVNNNHHSNGSGSKKMTEDTKSNGHLSTFNYFVVLPQVFLEGQLLGVRKILHLFLLS